MNDSQIWQLEGRCRKPDITENFYAENVKEQRVAAKICNSSCPVRRECLAYALLNNEESGVWGGVIPSERQGIYNLGSVTKGFFDGLTHQLSWYAHQHKR